MDIFYLHATLSNNANSSTPRKISSCLGMCPLYIAKAYTRTIIVLSRSIWPEPKYRFIVNTKTQYQHVNRRVPGRITQTRWGAPRNSTRGGALTSFDSNKAARVYMHVHLPTPDEVRDLRSVPTRGTEMSR